MLAPMTELPLRAGETLRIRSGRRLLLVLRPASACRVRVVKRSAGMRFARAVLAWWLRLHRFGAPAMDAYRRRELQRRLASRL
jgi:hypothetical protein